MNINAVIFDLDGTLADTIPLTVHSLREVTREYTGKVFSDEEIIGEFGPIDTEIVKTLVGSHSNEGAVEMYLNHFRDNFESYVKPIEGIIELLRYLKSKGIKAGIFTGRSEILCHMILDKLKIKEYFDDILAGDGIKYPKPGPEGILKAMENLQVSSSESIYVGDFDVDVQASKAAGTKSVLALWSSTASEKFKKQNPDKAFESPYDFIEWLKSME